MALAGLVLIAVEDAGFTAHGQVVFACVAGVGALVALLADPGAAADAARRPVTVALLALGALAVASSGWVIERADGTDAVRWGFVVVGFAAFVLMGAVAGARRQSLVWLMGGIAAVAVGEGALGLLAAAQRELPHAQRIGGSWRPGGSLQAPLSLALLQVAALPALLAGTGLRSRWAAALSAGGLAISLGTIATAGSRMHIAVASIVGIAALLWGSRVRLRRSDVGVALGLGVAAAAVIDAVIGGYTPPRAVGGDAARMAVSAAAVVLVAAGWVPMRAAARRLAERYGDDATRRRRAVAATASLLAVVAAGVIISASVQHDGRGVEPYGGLAHGRVPTWSAAVQTALDRPVTGSGAGSFLVASAPHQPPGTRPSFALQLNLELWAELGIGGLLLSLALYAGAALACWQARASPAAWLAIPAVGAYLMANLLDWTWHMPMTGAVFGLATGIVLARSP
ncbi:MAG: hypothetical protein ACJ762_07060 [Solirubrobacteraceae bacterium]